MKGLFVALFAILCVQLALGNPRRFVRDTTAEEVATTEAATTVAATNVETTESTEEVLIQWSDLDLESKIDSLGDKGLKVLEDNLNGLQATYKLNDYGLADGEFIPNLPHLLKEKAGIEY